MFSWDKKVCGQELLFSEVGGENDRRNSAGSSSIALACGSI